MCVLSLRRTCLIYVYMHFLNDFYLCPEQAVQFCNENGSCDRIWDDMAQPDQLEAARIIMDRCKSLKGMHVRAFHAYMHKVSMYARICLAHVLSVSCVCHVTELCRFAAVL